MKHITIQQKLDTLYKINHTKKKKHLKYQQLLPYLKDRSPFIRYDALCRLEDNFKKNLKPQDLLPSIYDSDQVVAMETIRILTFVLNYKDKKIFERSLELLREMKGINWAYGCNLIEALEDYPKLISWGKISFLFDNPGQVVRGYAYYMLRLFPQYKNKLYVLLEKEKSEYAKFDIFSALYELGEKHYLEELMNLIIKTRNTFDQKVGIIILKRHITKNNFRTILNFFLSEEAKKVGEYAQREIQTGIDLIHKRYPRLLKNPVAGKHL